MGTHTRMIAVANAMPLNMRPHAYLTPICDAEQLLKQLCIDAAHRSVIDPHLHGVVDVALESKVASTACSCLLLQAVHLTCLTSICDAEGLCRDAAAMCCTQLGACRSIRRKRCVIDLHQSAHTCIASSHQPCCLWIDWFCKPVDLVCLTSI
jgi:hypothetical protein